MKRKVSTIFLLLLIVPAVFAADIEAVLAKAKECSKVYQEYELSYQNTLLNQQRGELYDDKLGQYLSGAVFSVDGGYEYSENGSTVKATTLSVSVPDLYDDIKLVFSTELSDFTTKTSPKVSPVLNVSKTFDIRNYEDTRDDINDLITALQIGVNYKTNILNFENNLLNAVISIMQAENSLKTSETSYNRLLKSYENDISLGVITAGSLLDIEQKMNIEKTALNLETSKKNYEKSLKDFKQQYGIEYEPVSEVSEADLTFTSNPAENSSVLLAKYNLEISKQNYAAACGYSDTLNVGGTAKASVDFNNKKSSFDLAASLSYISDNWSVSTSVSDTFGAESSMIPTVKIYGSWSSGTVKSKSDELYLQTLYNAVLEKENSYNNALYSYSTDALNLENEISTYKWNVEQQRIQTDYDKAVLDYQTRLFDMGLTTQQAVEDAKSTYGNDLNQSIILKLQALVLENKIKIIEL